MPQHHRPLGSRLRSWSALGSLALAGAAVVLLGPAGPASAASPGNGPGVAVEQEVEQEAATRVKQEVEQEVEQEVAPGASRGVEQE
jgi:hypothetical protein